MRNLLFTCLMVKARNASLKTENKMRMLILSLLPSTALRTLVTALWQEEQTKSICRKEVRNLYMQKTGLYTQITLSKLQK